MPIGCLGRAAIRRLATVFKAPSEKLAARTSGIGTLPASGSGFSAGRQQDVRRQCRQEPPHIRLVILIVKLEEARTEAEMHVRGAHARQGAASVDHIPLRLSRLPSRRGVELPPPRTVQDHKCHLNVPDGRRVARGLGAQAKAPSSVRVQSPPLLCFVLRAWARGKRYREDNLTVGILATWCLCGIACFPMPSYNVSGELASSASPSTTRRAGLPDHDTGHRKAPSPIC